MRISKKLLSVLLAVAMTVCLLPAATLGAAADDYYHGSCGANVNWTFNEETATLTISGTGDMEDFNETSAPWCEYGELIQKIIVEEGVTRIGTNAFSDCFECVSVDIPASVVSDLFDSGVRSLSGIGCLTSINVAEGNLYYASDDGILFNKSKTRLICYPAGRSGSYTVPDGVTTIDMWAFLNCHALTDVTIPDSVTSIGLAAFYNCYGLKRVTIPASVTEIATSAFSNCYRLFDIAVAEDNPNYSAADGALFNKDKTVLICHPGAVAAYAVPDGVKSIGQSAFGCDCVLRLALPASLTTIEYGAFADLDVLHGLYFLGTREQWEAISVGENNDVLSYVPIHFGEPLPLPGDVDGNGVAEAADLTALARHTGGIEELTDEAALISADADSNAVVDARDLTALARKVGGIA